VKTSDTTCCVIDNGQFIEIGRALGRQVKKCYYWSPADRSLPLIQEAVIGSGFPEMERVSNIWKIKDKCDFFVFPDLGHSGLQKELIAQGFPVWGARDGDRLESDRGLFFDTLKELGMEVPPHEVIEGITSLRLFLKDKEDKWVKISKWRGNFETFHWVDWEQTEPALDDLAVEFGSEKEDVLFYVCDPIETDIEDGVDSYCIDGWFPDRVLHGMEHKDKSFIGTMCDWDDLPEQVKLVNNDFAEALKKFDYRGFFSTEVRILPDKFYFIDPTCFSDDTEVLTDSGWKLFSNLKRQDRVATRYDSGKIQYQKPTAYINHQFEGEMVLITNNKKTIECLVTPNHNVLRTGRKGDETCLQRADSLTDKGYIPRTGWWSGARPEFFELPAYKHSWLSGRWRKCFKEKNCPPLMIPMKTMLKFMGYYLSEGSVGGGDWLVSIAQFKHKDKMVDDLQDFPIQPRLGDSGFQLHSVQLAEYCKQFGKCSEKFIPEWIGRLCPEYINIFLDAYTLGDGSVRSGSRTIYTTSRRIADGLQELFFKAGSVASIFERETAGTSMECRGKKYIRNHNILIVSETKRHDRFWFETGCRKERYIKRVPYKGAVYCVTVPNSTLYVRRNGKPFWSGNCRAASPPHQLMTEIFKNFADILHQGARGDCINPIETAEFGVQALLSYKRNEKEWVKFKIPESIERNVKCGFCYQKDGLLCFPPHPLETMAGYLVATGDSIKEAIGNLQDAAKELPPGLECADKTLAELLKEIAVAEKHGMEFTPQEIPEPVIVLED
jgi:hypothetical protein